MTERDADGFFVKNVWSSDPAEYGEDKESMRLWLWFATKQADGKVIMSYDDFFKVPSDAVIRWRVDLNTLTITVEAS